MFGIDSGELLIIAIVTIVVVGPKDLPRVLYKVGQLMGKVRSITQHFRTGIDAMVREVELEELQKKWAADNQRIMNEHGAGADVSDPSTAALTAEATGTGAILPADTVLVDTGPADTGPADAPALPYETPDYVVDVESLDNEHKPPKPEAAA